MLSRPDRQTNQGTPGGECRRSPRRLEVEPAADRLGAVVAHLDRLDHLAPEGALAANAQAFLRQHRPVGELEVGVR
jgi:hypothetical protein